MLHKRRSSPPLSCLPAGLRATSSAASRSSLADTQADDDVGRGERHGHQPRSTDAICGDAAEPRQPLGGGESGTDWAAGVNNPHLWLLLLHGGPKHLSEPYTTYRGLPPLQSADPQASRSGSQAELS